MPISTATAQEANSHGLLGPRRAVRYDFATVAVSRSLGRRPTLAREKNTSRAEARRRTREQMRAEMEPEDLDEVEGPESLATEVEQPRRPTFKIPNVLQDVRGLPALFREKRLLWLPVIMSAIGFILILTVNGLPLDIQPLALTYIQVFFVPQGLLTYFIAGFLAPRSSYLLAGLLGLINGILLPIGLVLTLPPGSPLVTTGDVFSGIVSYGVTGMLFGSIAGWFAGWYRDFLRNMANRNRATRANKEVDERAKRRELRQEARRVAKQRPTN